MGDLGYLLNGEVEGSRRLRRDREEFLSRAAGEAREELRKEIDAGASDSRSVRSGPGHGRGRRDRPAPPRRVARHRAARRRGPLSRRRRTLPHPRQRVPSALPEVRRARCPRCSRKSWAPRPDSARSPGCSTRSCSRWHSRPRSPGSWTVSGRGERFAARSHATPPHISSGSFLEQRAHPERPHRARAGEPAPPRGRDPIAPLGGPSVRRERARTEQKPGMPKATRASSPSSGGFGTGNRARDGRPRARPDGWTPAACRPRAAHALHGPDPKRRRA